MMSLPPEIDEGMSLVSRLVVGNHLRAVGFVKIPQISALQFLSIVP